MKKIILCLFSVIMCLVLTSCSQYTGNMPVSRQPFPQAPSQVALLVPLSGAYAAAGSAIRDGFLAAYYQDLSKNNQGQLPTIKVYDTGKGSVTQIYNQAVKDGADLVVGPLSKSNVRRISGDVGKVPVLALNYLNSRRPRAGFYQFGLSPQNEASQVAQKALSQGKSRGIVIYPNTNWGKDVVSAFAKPFEENGGKIVDQLAFTPSTDLRTSISDLLQLQQGQQRTQQLEKVIGDKVTSIPHIRQDFDMFFLVASPQQAKQIMPLLRFYYAGNIPVYATSSVYDGVPNTNFYRDLDGIIFCDMPWELANNPKIIHKQKQVASTWPDPYQSYIKLYALGMDAYLLTQKLNDLATQPGLTISGATGTLYMNNNQQIYQQLPWAHFVNGKAEKMS